MRKTYRRAMEKLYLACVVLAGLALVSMTAVIPWGVFTRYVLGHGSAWPEPFSVLMVIVFTFTAAPACYRAGLHISVTLVADMARPSVRRVMELIAELLMATIAVFMIVWGIYLVDTTWGQVIAEFPFLSVGISYLPIPIGGALTVLFIAERWLIGPPDAQSIIHRAPVETSRHLETN